MRSFAAGLLLHLLVNGPALTRAEVPTFTANSGATYFSDATASPGPDELSIDTSNGIDVTFGSEWTKRIHDTLEADCADNRSEDCLNSVRDVLGVGGSAASSGLQPRAITAAAAVGGILIANTIAIIISLWKDDASKYEVIHVNIPKTQVEEVSNYDFSENKFNFAPMEGDAIEVDLNYSPASKPAEEDIPSVETLEDGGLEFYDGGLGQEFSDAAAAALCGRSVRRALVKRVTLQCIKNQIEAALRRMVPGGPLANLMYINPADFKTPTDLDVDMIELLNHSKEFAEKLELPKDTNKEVREKAAEYVAFVEVAQTGWGLAYGQEGKMPIKYSVMTKAPSDGATEEDEENPECPTELAKMPICEHCGGNAETDDWDKGTGKCKGVDANGKTDVYKDCTCILVPKRTDEGADQQLMQDLADALDDLINGGGSSEEPSEDKPEEKTKNKAISIKLQDVGGSKRWVVYETEQGKAATCGNNKAVYTSSMFEGGDITNPGLASGDWHFRAWNRECSWRGNGENPGELVCQDERFGCFKAENAATKDDCPEDIKETESLNCAFDSDGDATKFVGGTCTVRWWYDYNAAIVIGGKTKLRIEGIWDNASNNIGGAWGHAEAGDVIKNDQKIDIKSELSSAVTMAVMGKSDYSKDYGFMYSGKTWASYDSDTSKLPHCRQDRTIPWHKNGNREKEFWSCYFSC